jgi:hypothetical protein
MSSYLATCIGMHVRFCKTGCNSSSVLQSNLQPDGSVTADFRLPPWTGTVQPLRHVDHDQRNADSVQAPADLRSGTLVAPVARQVESTSMP